MHHHTTSLALVPAAAVEAVEQAKVVKDAVGNILQDGDTVEIGRLVARFRADVRPSNNIPSTMTSLDSPPVPVTSQPVAARMRRRR